MENKRRLQAFHSLLHALCGLLQAFNIVTDFQQLVTDFQLVTVFQQLVTSSNTMQGPTRF